MSVGLLGAKGTAKKLESLIKDYDQIYIAAAWGSNSQVADHLIQNKEKFVSVIFGISFCQTDPDLIDRLVGVKNAFVATSEKVTFHPKLYYFQSGDTAEAIVGSSNFTNGGLDRNHEANLHVKGPSNSKVFADIRAQIEKYRPIQRPVTKELAESYRLQHNAARLLPKPRNPSLPGTSAFAAQLASPLARLDWEAYVKAVKSSPYHNFKARLGLLRECQRMFASVSSFADLSNSEWKAIAGVIGEKQKQEAKLAQHDWGWFGSMKGMGDFANRIAEKDEAIANALDAIPRHGEVSEANYDQFRKEFLRAFKNSSRVGGVPTATRLLAMKRPDTFVCISKPNKAGLAEALGFPKTALELDNYWQRVIEPVRMSPWYCSQRPLGADAELWDGRVAMLDAIYYRP